MDLITNLCWKLSWILLVNGSQADIGMVVIIGWISLTNVLPVQDTQIHLKSGEILLVYYLLRYSNRFEMLHCALCKIENSFASEINFIDEWNVAIFMFLRYFPKKQ